MSFFNVINILSLLPHYNTIINLLFHLTSKFYFYSETNVVFKFPQPMILDGVKTKGTPILQINNCDFTYPGAKKPQLIGVTVKCSMASRVACVGANGAGKSTMIKILTGEMKPSSGTVKKHVSINTKSEGERASRIWKHCSYRHSDFY